MIIAVLIYFVLLIIYAVNKQYWGVSIFMIALYLFSLLFSTILVSNKYNNVTPGLVPSIIYCLALTLLFSPFFIKRPIIKAPTEKEENLMVKIFSSISVFFVISDIVIFPAIALAYAAGANDIRSGNAIVFSSVLTGYRSLIYFIISGFFGLSYLLIVIFFYSLAFIKKRVGFKVLLLTASLTAPYIGLLDGGRTNMVYWILMVIASFIIFKPYFKKEVKYKTYVLLSIPLAVLVSLFMVASIDRFEYREGGTEGGLITYAGQSFVNFCDFYDNFDSPMYSLQRILPRLSSFFYGPFDLDQYRNIVMARSHMDIGIFYTLLGDLLVDVGLIGMFLYIIIYKGVCKSVVNKKYIGLPDIILLSLFLQIPIHGVFYYSLWSIKASNAIILTVLLCLFFKNKEKSQ